MAVAHGAAVSLLTLFLVSSRHFGVPEVADDRANAAPAEWSKSLFKNVGHLSSTYLGRSARSWSWDSEGIELEIGQEATRLRGGAAPEVLADWSGQSRQQAMPLLEIRGGGTKKLQPFARGRPSMKIDGKVEATLRQGKAHSTSGVTGHSFWASAVIDIKAPPEGVWKQLNDFGSYPKKAPMLNKCEVYERNGQRTKVKFVSPVVPGVKLTYHVDHTYEQAKNSITWTLDDNKKNDFIDVQGHWHVEPHPEDPSMSRVWYEIATTMPEWIPKWIIKKMPGRGVSDATGWVKRESEKAAPQASGMTRGPSKGPVTIFAVLVAAIGALVGLFLARLVSIWPKRPREGQTPRTNLAWVVKEALRLG